MEAIIRRTQGLAPSCCAPFVALEALEVGARAEGLLPITEGPEDGLGSRLFFRSLGFAQKNKSH